VEEHRVDVDFGQIRAFVAVVDERHFGRAADLLSITQQGLSKRIQRLEQVVGQPLLERNGRGVELTPAGDRFLPHARRLLDGLEAAAGVLRSKPDRVSALRVDVWGPAMLAMLTERMPDLLVAASLRRNFRAAVRALCRSEVDAALGRVHGLGEPLLPNLAHRLVRMERYGVAVASDHPLRSRGVVTPADLAGYVLWFPAARQGSEEMLPVFQGYADHVGARLDTSGHYPGVDTDPAIEAVRRDRRRLLLCPAHRDFASTTGLEPITLDPAPCYPWSLVWRDGDQHPTLPMLLRRLEDVGEDEDWLAFDPGHDWLPDVDRRLVSPASR
jgi:DNA-binding transcriptional LysR family regulator